MLLYLHQRVHQTGGGAEVAVGEANELVDARQDLLHPRLPEGTGGPGGVSGGVGGDARGLKGKIWRHVHIDRTIIRLLFIWIVSMSSS